MGPVKSVVNETGKNADDIPVRPAVVAEIIALIDEGKISHAAATQRIFPELLQGRNTSPIQLAKELNLIQERNEETIQPVRSEEHTSELQSRENLVCRLLLEKK